MDWATAAAVIVAVAAIIGVILQFFKKEKPWRAVTEDNKLRITTIETEIKHITERVETLREKIDEHDLRDQRDFERIESKIEKLTDLMIEIIQKGGNTKSKSTKSQK